MRKDHYLRVRITPEQHTAIATRAKAAGLSRSDYARSLVLLPPKVSSGDLSDDRIVILERDTFKKLYRLILSHGRLYNQAVHAMNIIALSVKAGELMYETDARRLLSEAKSRLTEANELVGQVEDAVARLEQAAKLYMKGGEL